MSIAAAVATARFGLGARPGELARAAADPHGWLLAQLGPAGVPDRLVRLPDSWQRTRELLERRRQGDGQTKALLRKEHKDAYLVEIYLRALARIESADPFRERLVAFWSNHFTVSMQRPGVLALVGPFEREAIRPHVTGRFADLLRAVARHPAMLFYLDQANSYGPNSPQGRRRGRGLNENLAREILELHTLGVGGGYGQDDVIAFARILTGWSVSPLGESDAGAFRFHAAIHEPGDKVLLGRRFAEAGEAEGRAALDMLARHPATARFVATKFARHFVADDPPAAAVERLTAVFRDTDGDLGALARAAVAMPEAWAEPLGKVRSADDYLTAALRATAVELPGKQLGAAWFALGQMPFAAPSPAGWPDRAADWIGPEAVRRRAEIAELVAERAAASWRPDALLESALGAAAGSRTRAFVGRAPSIREALALLLASPEMQCR